MGKLAVFGAAALFLASSHIIFTTLQTGINRRFVALHYGEDYETQQCSSPSGGADKSAMDLQIVPGLRLCCTQGADGSASGVFSLQGSTDACSGFNVPLKIEFVFEEQRQLPCAKTGLLAQCMDGCPQVDRRQIMSILSAAALSTSLAGRSLSASHGWGTFEQMCNPRKC